jgi:NAD(P)-dependent dehydrogenase (short-subunit alcohol dehydrogenase family)
LDLLVNVAGILHADTSIKSIKYEHILNSFKVNTIGPLLVAKHFYDLLAKKKYSGAEAFEQGAPISILANISAKAGSIGENSVGGWTSQRSTKSALNMITKNEAIEFKNRGVVCVSIDPGIVDTDMTAPYKKNFPQVLPIELASEQITNILFHLSMNDTGKFISHDGKELPW